MWICPRCNRTFKADNQSHMCSKNTLDDILEGKPDDLILAFDKILVGVIDWEPCTVGASKKAIVFTKEKAWLIVRPMSKELDVKFYYDEIIQHPLIKKTAPWGEKHAHHIRIKNEYEVTEEFFALVRKGYEYE